MNRLALLFALLLALPLPAAAERARIDLGAGLIAQAEYRPGQGSRPAVLLLHGFLQTHEFATVAALARGLADAGYPVLTPTLSLGIPNRKKSLACEAVHLHSMQGDQTEIKRWIKWLNSRGHQRIVLVGHSFGSLQLLAYLSGKPDPSVHGFIAASLIETQIGARPRAALIASLRDAVKRGDHGLVRHPVSYCKKYPSSPDALLSYVLWDRARIVDALGAYKGEKLLVMGSADEMIDQDWLTRLARTGTPMAVVERASHFMDGEHEFDLLELSLEMLKKLDAPARP